MKIDKKSSSSNLIFQTRFDRYGGRLLQAGCIAVYGKTHIDLHLIKFEKSSWMNLIFCRFQTWIFQATQVCKSKVRNGQKIKFIQLDFSNSIFSKGKCRSKGWKSNNILLVFYLLVHLASGDFEMKVLQVSAFLLV